MSEIISSERLNKFVYEVLKIYPQEFARRIGVERSEGVRSLLRETPTRTSGLQKTIFRKYPQYKEWLTGATGELPADKEHLYKPQEDYIAAVVKESAAVYNADNRDFYRNKYFELQEKYSKLQEDYITALNLLHLSKEKIWKLERLVDHHKEFAEEENINLEKTHMILRGIEELEMNGFNNN